MSVNRKPSGISQMRTLLKDASPSVVFLASGVPNVNMFPFKYASITLENDQTLKITPELMATALQYGPTPGYQPLVQQLKEMVHRLHKPPRWTTSDVIVTVGCQDGMSKAFEMLLDPGDYVVVEEPCYSDALVILSAVKPTYLKVDVDERGMRPQALRDVLQQTREKDATKIPKVNS
ncbi:hypothetical protein SK128_003507 [Halocaridina rubra]|uniref:Aminotransferase class I/classII large domain-containing protein n=1 Tax=Halocaridina rubra TaxID=373956 RepID=A0AAN8ZXL6_HALRR